MGGKARSDARSIRSGIPEDVNNGSRAPGSGGFYRVTGGTSTWIDRFSPPMSVSTIGAKKVIFRTLKMLFIKGRPRQRFPDHMISVNLQR
jgi:hypothetical protein